MISSIKSNPAAGRAATRASPPFSPFSHSRWAISQIAVRKIQAHQALRAETSGSGPMIEYGHFIGGKQVAGKSGRIADVFQPMDGTVRAKVALASQAEMRAAVEDAEEAQLAS